MSEPPQPGVSVPRPVTVHASDDQVAEDVDLDRWATLARQVLETEMVPADSEMSLLFVDAPTMAELNRRHMGAEGPTDVLAFPIDDVTIERVGDDPLVVGDVVICPDVARANAPAHAGSFEDEIALLVVHGVLHLLGMDHTDADERTAMQARERELLERHHGSLVGDPWRS